VVFASRKVLENTFVQAEMFEATEFPDLVERYDVSGVPQTTINDSAAHVVGSVEEDRVAAINNFLQ
jgi:Thioredoxin domain